MWSGAVTSSAARGCSGYEQAAIMAQILPIRFQEHLQVGTGCRPRRFYQYELFVSCFDSDVSAAFPRLVSVWPGLWLLHTPTHTHTPPFSLLFSVNTKD